MRAPSAPRSGAVAHAPPPGAGEARRTVRVAVANTEAWSTRAAAFDAILDASERARIARMRFERDRLALKVAYGLHRVLLAGELDLPASAVPLGRDPLGRPRVAGDRVWTSLSHSTGWVAIAVDARAPVGVDLEPLSRAAVLEEIAEAVVHADEQASIAGRSSESRQAVLLALWVRKEAALKAAGVGLRVPMASFPIVSNGATRIPGSDAHWRVRGIDTDLPIELALATVDEPDISYAVVEPHPLRDAAIAYASRS